MLERFVNKNRRKNRIRAKVAGNATRPRLSLSVSNMHVIAQIIDDQAGKTLVYVSEKDMKLSGTKTEKSAAVGKQVAELAKKAKINEVVFDRGGKLYHGRVKALADAARENGLKF